MSFGSGIGYVFFYIMIPTFFVFSFVHTASFHLRLLFGFLFFVFFGSC